MVENTSLGLKLNSMICVLPWLVAGTRSFCNCQLNPNRDFEAWHKTHPLGREAE